MAASISFLNSMLNSGVAGVQAVYTGIYVSLYSGGSAVTGANYNNQLISAFNAASNATKAATARVNFAPTGAAAGGWGYDSVRLFSNNSGVELHSIAVNPTQFIANGDTHQILVTFSGV